MFLSFYNTYLYALMFFFTKWLILFTWNEFMKNPFKFIVCINILHLSCFKNRNKIDYIFLWTQKKSFYHQFSKQKNIYTLNRYNETKKNKFWRLNQQPTKKSIFSNTITKRLSIHCIMYMLFHFVIKKLGFLKSSKAQIPFINQKNYTMNCLSYK